MTVDSQYEIWQTWNSENLQFQSGIHGLGEECAQKYFYQNVLIQEYLKD